MKCTNLVQTQSHLGIHYPVQILKLIYGSVTKAGKNVQTDMSAEIEA